MKSMFDDKCEILQYLADAKAEGRYYSSQELRQRFGCEPISQLKHYDYIEPVLVGDNEALQISLPGEKILSDCLEQKRQHKIGFWSLIASAAAALISLAGVIIPFFTQG